MRLLWLSYAVGVLVAVVAGQECQDKKGNTYQEGQIWLKNDCSKEFTCANGAITREPYSCPDNSNCVKGVCKCNDGFEAKLEKNTNKLKRCKAVDVETSNECEDKDGNKYQKGDKWLSKDCGLEYTCKDGTAEEKEYSCPDNSFCLDGKCECDPGFTAKLDNKNRLKRCRQTDAEVENEEAKSCQHQGQTYQNGESWRSNNCKKLFKCVEGDRTEEESPCPDNSECENRECVCKDGFEAVTRQDKSLRRCKEGSSCVDENTKLIYENGKVWLQADCLQKFKCKKGTVKPESYGCPKNTHCNDDGQCVCDFGYSAAKTDKDGLLKKCKEEKEHKCGDGFRRKYGKCLAIDKYSNLNYYDASTKCREKGGRLLVANDLFGLFKKFKKDNKLKFYIGAAPEISVKDLQDIEKEQTRQFVLRMMDRNRCGESDRYRAFRKFSARAKAADLNNVTPLSSKCLAFDCKDEKAPTLVNCNARMGYICEEVRDEGGEEGDAKWSQWFNTNTDISKGDKESLNEVLHSLNKKENNAIRLCKRPLKTECREVGTDKLYTKDETHGLKLNKACENHMIRCRNRRQRNGKTCSDFEIRFKCPVDEANDCSVRQIRRACENKGRKCVNRADGARCVKEKRKKNKKEKVNIRSCVNNGQKITLHQCKASGDPHYTTLDQKKFDFQGTCSYDFISTCKSYVGTEDYPAFSIVVKNYKKDDKKKVSWTKYFELSLGETKYVFADRKLYKVTGSVREENQLGFSDDLISITGCQKTKNIKITVETKFCLVIQWDNAHALSIFVPEIYKNYVCGLCGNFDDNPDNDHINPETGKMMSMQQMGREYLVKGPDGEICNSVVPVPTPCSDDNWAKYKKAEFCGIFDIESASPIAKAVVDGSDSSVLDVNKRALGSELFDCITDLCWDDTTDRCHDLEDALEDIMTGLVLDKEALDDVWRQYAGCKDEEKRCSKPHMVYSSAFVPTCQDTCKAQDQSKNCVDRETETGCVCEKDYFLDANFNCVPEEECKKTCTHSIEEGRSITLNNGDVYVIRACERIARCVDGEIVEEDLGPCSPHAECSDFGKKCKCRKGFTGDGIECRTDLKCRPGYKSYGKKCYKYVERKLNWHDAAINCGADGSALARYDVESDEELANFFKDLPTIISRRSARRKTINCRQGGKCRLPKNHIGVAIKLKNKKRDKEKCNGNFKLSDDGTSIDIQGDCQARFVVRMINLKKQKKVVDLRSWIGGASTVISQNKRIKYSPWQIDPPRMLDMAIFKDQVGCFQARLNKEDVLLITPNPKCNKKKASICEYDNPGKPIYDPNDFKGIEKKATHEEAVRLCAEQNRPLATITNKKQLKRVLKILTKFGGDGWLSAKYNPEKDKFLWSDNTEVKSKNWRKNEPNNYKGNKNDEVCVSIDKNKGFMFSDNCNDRLHPLCGPPLDIPPVAYSPYYPVENFKTLDELRQILVRENRDEYVCENPLAMDCVARDEKTGEWVSNQDLQGEIITCTPTLIKCRRGRGVRCKTLKARFLCPTDENQCRSLKEINVTPCDGGRICLPVRNHYICRCPNGKKYNEHTQSCSSPCGVCYTWGDPHYTTYSGARYDFMGTCLYKYSGVCDLGEYERDPNFDVYTKNEPCGKSGKAVSCIYSIEVHLRNMPVKKPDGRTRKKNFIFRLSRGTSEYTLNDQAMTQVELQEPGAFTVHRRRDFFELYSEILDLNVVFTGTKLTVKVPDKFRGHMCGLCGDCDSDGFRLRNGTVVNVPTRGNKLDRQQIIPVANDFIEPHPDTDPEICKVVDPLDECTEEQKRVFSQADKCGIFKDADSSISSCFSTVDPDPYYLSCLEDACNSDPMVSVCSSVKSYAQSCAAKNKILDWRRENFCYMNCGDKEYRSVASCQPTCGRSVISVANCAEEPEEGCVCPDGFMRRGEECVRPDNCGCEITLREGEPPWLLAPGESVLLPGCLEKSTCEVDEDGNSQEVIDSFPLDPNAICIEGRTPTVGCAKGFIMQEDGVTCIKDPEGCSQGYEDREGMCISVPRGKRIWRQAIEACNKEDGTLVLIDTNVKLNEIGNIMKKKSFKQVFISGQVRALVGPTNDVTYESVLTQRGKIEYENFDYHEPLVSAILLSEALTVDQLKDNTTVLALVARLEEEDKVNIYAVPRDTVTNFICEGRNVPEDDTEWYPPCNSDDVMKGKGDIEKKKALLRNPDCKVCPKPMEIRCSDVAGATGLVKGECRMRRSGVYYSCEQGEDCLDQAVSTKCAKDVDECEENLHDCSPRSKCVNLVGAYMCQCVKEFPLMVNNRCEAKKTCEMVGPTNPLDYLYRVTGFSGRPGYFDYDCSFQMAGLCEYEPSMGIPLLTLFTKNERTDSGVKHVIAGAIYDHITNELRTWAVAAESLQEGKFLFGKADNLTLTGGMTCGQINTRFTYSSPNKLIIRHLDNYFKIFISFPMNIEVSVSEAYANRMCGICTLEPPSANEKIQLTEEQTYSVSVQRESPCLPPPNIPTTTRSAERTTTPQPPPNAEETTTKVPTTQPITLPPTTLAPTTPTTLAPTTLPPPPTTLPPPPTTLPQPQPPTTQLPIPTTIPTTPQIIVDDFCLDEMQSCNAVEAMCGYPMSDCMDSVCFGEMDICAFLMSRTFDNCLFGASMEIFIQKHSQCDDYCGPDMQFDFIFGIDQPTCSDPNEDGALDEGSFFEGVFSCVCASDTIFSGGACVPQDECGCLTEDETYVEKDVVWNNENCTKKYTCDGGNQIYEEPMRCSENAACVSSDEGYNCECDEGFFGLPEEEGGCTKGDEDDPTKVCYGYIADGAIETTCMCKMGYVSDCINCIDLDECKEEVHKCHRSTERCVNEPGGYRCECAVGFKDKDGDCVDIDECAEEDIECGKNQGCVNVPGKYICECCTGFTMEGDACVESGEVEILTDKPQCCMDCDDPDLCNELEHVPWCLRTDKGDRMFPTYRALFMFACVNNIRAPRNMRFRDKCPELPRSTTAASDGGQATAPSGSGPTGGQNPPTVGPSGEESTSGNPPPETDSTAPAPTKPTTKRPKSCNDENFCDDIPPPDDNLKTGPVCGPDSSPNPQTYENYCEMVRAVCKSLGSPDDLPPQSIKAAKNACPTPTTTTPPTPPTVTAKEPAPTGNAEPENTAQPEVTEGPPIDQGPEITEAPPETPVEPLWSTWSKFIPCMPVIVEKGCGPGVQSRTRYVIPFSDDRPVRLAKDIDLIEERTCFVPCDPNDPDFDPDDCGGDGVCGVYEPVCGAIGREGTQTFDTECDLNVQACERSEIPYLIHRGPCGQDEGPSTQRMCEDVGPILKRIVSEESEDGLDCYGDIMLLHTCSDLLCEGTSDTCCVPTDFKKKTRSVDCFDKAGEFKDTRTHVYLSALACKCESSVTQSNDEL